MLLNRAYYFAKPAIPPRLRLAVRRYWAKRLRRRLTESWPINEAAGRPPHGWPGWPDGKDFAFVLTHDVEGQKGLDRCCKLAELDMRLGFRSSFNFVPAGQYATPESLRDFLTAHGFEVGVHDLRHDGKLYSSRQGFAAAAERINHYLATWQAVGFRSGSMLHDLRALRALSILYDASTFDTDPFEPQPDGVNTIFPFWVPRHDGSGYVELPYTLPQDSTLFVLLQEASIGIWKTKLDWLVRCGGMALIDVHPDYMSFDGTRSLAEYDAHLYREFLEYLLERYRHRCWFALPRDVAHYAAQTYATTAVHLGAHPPDSTPHLRMSSHDSSLRGKRAAVISFSPYPTDSRPRRAAEALVNEGMNVDVICLGEDRQEPRRETFKGVDIFRLPISRRRGGRLEYLAAYAAFILASFTLLGVRCLSRRYDLVHVHNMPDILVVSSLIPKALGAKVILDLHDPMPELMMTIFNLRQRTPTVRLLQRLEKWCTNLADVVLTVNLACKQLFVSRGCYPDKITVVMNSPDDEIFPFRPPPSATSTIRDPSKPFVIMYHGSAVERNGLDLAVDALARVRQAVPTAELRIYSARTHFLERIRESIRAQGLDSAVRFLGLAPPEDIVDAIAKCDVGIIPNHRNIFTELNTPTRIFEYLALGKPVISPRAPGIQDYFNNESLVFFELGNAEDLARKLEHVYLHPSETIEVVKRGQQVYLAHTWRQERQTFMNLVGTLLDGDHRAHSAE